MFGLVSIGLHRLLNVSQIYTANFRIFFVLDSFNNASVYLHKGFGVETVKYETRPIN
jgi:hypothetical protein